MPALHEQGGGSLFLPVEFGTPHSSGRRGALATLEKLRRQSWTNSRGLSAVSATASAVAEPWSPGVGEATIFSGWWETTSAGLEVSQEPGGFWFLEDPNPSPSVSFQLEP